MLPRHDREKRFEALVHAYTKDLYRWGHSLCHDPVLTEDLVQETFARAWKNRNYSAQKNHKKSLTGFLRIFPAFSAIQGLASNPCLRSIIIL